MTVPILHGNPSGLFVGVDAYIDPAEQADFTEVYGKFATFLGPMWASAPTQTVHALYCFTKSNFFNTFKAAPIGAALLFS